MTTVGFVLAKALEATEKVKASATDNIRVVIFLICISPLIYLCF
jgi:hypothetical protein